MTIFAIAFLCLLVGGLIGYFFGLKDGKTEMRLRQAKPMLRRVK